MRLGLVIFCFFIALRSFSQTPQQWTKYAETSVMEQDFYGAALYYKQALELDVNNVETWFQYGLALKRTNNCVEAEKAFQEVFDRFEDPKHEVAQYWLAEMQKCQAKYEEALVNFRDYVRSARVRSIYEYAKAKQEVESTKYAIDNLEDSLKFTVEALPGEINTPLSEFCPRRHNDSMLLFSSLQYLKKKGALEVDKKEKGGLSNIYYSLRKDNVWGAWKNFDIPGLLPNHHIANACLGPEDDLYFSMCSPEGMCKIYRSLKEGNSWAEAMPLGEMINTEGSSHTQPYVCEIEGTIYLFYSSNQAKGRGQMDIWYSKYDKGRKAFARPRNMGRAVNTPGNEVSPFWDTEKNRLYFSSDWHHGFGGFDISYCEGVPNSLMPAKNPGIGMNSSANDLYYSRAIADTHAYLASNRAGGKALEGMVCCNDVYRLKELKLLADTVQEADSLLVMSPLDTLPVLSEKIPVPEEELEEELEVIQSYLPLALYFHNDEPNPRSWATSTSLSYDETYDAYYNLLGRYKKQYASLFVGPKADSAEISMQAFFEEKLRYGKETMDKALDALLHQLQNDKSIEITIKGFASPLARSDYNLNLTKRRIASFKNYIYTYKEGAFNRYLSAGDFTIIEEAFGESKADSTISDRLENEAGSIYSIGAAKERRIEILRVERK